MSRENSKGRGDSTPANRANDVRLVTLHFRVPLEVRKQLKLYAVRRGISMSELFLSAVEQAGILEKAREDEEPH